MDLPVIKNSHRIAALDKDNCMSKKCHLECINFCPVNKSGSECIILDSKTEEEVGNPELLLLAVLLQVAVILPQWNNRFQLAFYFN